MGFLEDRLDAQSEPSPFGVAPSRRMILASTSPRRRDLVRAFNPPPEHLAPSVDEALPQHGESPEHYVLRISAAKAASVASKIKGALVLGADTAVVLDSEILGKPNGAQHAIQMLAGLRGRAHRVVTGVTVLDSGTGRRACAAMSTDVTMRSYSDSEVASYVASGEPFDKAGAYGVQDEAFDPAHSLEGCYLNVVGLPVCRVVSLLEELGASPRLKSGWSPPDGCLDCPLRRKTGVERI